MNCCGGQRCLNRERRWVHVVVSTRGSLTCLCSSSKLRSAAVTERFMRNFYVNEFFQWQAWRNTHLPADVGTSSKLQRHRLWPLGRSSLRCCLVAHWLIDGASFWCRLAQCMGNLIILQNCVWSSLQSAGKKPKPHLSENKISRSDYEIINKLRYMYVAGQIFMVLLHT